MRKKKLLAMCMAAIFAMISLIACGGPLNSGSLQDGLDEPTGLVASDNLSPVFYQLWRQVEHPFLNGGIITIPTAKTDSSGSTSQNAAVFTTALRKLAPKTISSPNGKPGGLQLLSLPAGCLTDGMFETSGTVEIDLKCAANGERAASGKMLIDAQGLNPLHIKTNASVEGHLNVTFDLACIGGLCVDGKLSVELKQREKNTELLVTYNTINSYDSTYLKNYASRNYKKKTMATVQEEVRLQGGLRTTFNEKGVKSVEVLTPFKNKDGQNVSLALKIEPDATQNGTRTTLRGQNGTFQCTLHPNGLSVSCKTPTSRLDDHIVWFNHFGLSERQKGWCFFYC